MKPLWTIPAVLLLSGCLGGPMSLLTGGGPNVAANVQAGAENNQALSQVDTSTTSEAGRDVITVTELDPIKPQGNVESIEVMNQDIPVWVILLLILGWVLPSPKEIWRGFLKTITLGKYRG